MDAIKFSKNWNNKLNNEAFTTFRMANPDIYYEGNSVKVILDGQPFRPDDFVTILKIKTMKLSEIDDWISFVDAGVDSVEFIEIIKNIYKDIDVNDVDFCLLLLKWGNA